MGSVLRSTTEAESPFWGRTFGLLYQIRCFLLFITPLVLHGVFEVEMGR